MAELVTIPKDMFDRLMNICIDEAGEYTGNNHPAYDVNPIVALQFYGSLRLREYMAWRCWSAAFAIQKHMETAPSDGQQPTRYYVTKAPDGTGWDVMDSRAIVKLCGALDRNQAQAMVDILNGVVTK